MANLIKKVIVLSLLLVAVFAVYVAKNQDLRGDVLIRLGLAASKDFKIPEEIVIGMEDINIGSLELEEEAEEVGIVEVQPSLQAATTGEEQSSLEATASQGGIGVGSVEAWEDKPLVSLEDIEKQVGEIAQQIELIRQEIGILVAMNEVRQEIKDLAREKNILSSI